MIGTKNSSNLCNEAIGLLMTYRCNLNCKYCYISKKRNIDMTFDMARSIIEPYLKKSEGTVYISFLGGETLLAIDIIRPIIEWIEHGHWNRPYIIHGTTNGTLLNDDLKIWLREHKHSLTLALSYDGIPLSQRNNRGRDNIDIDFFINTWPQQPIQMTITSETVDQMADGVIYLLEKGAIVHPNVAYETNEWPDNKLLEYGRQLNKLINYYNTHKKYPIINQFTHDLCEYANCIDHPKPNNEICGACNGLKVFDTDGKYYPCHILSPLVLEGEKLEAGKNGIVTETTDYLDDTCLTCPYSSSCPTCIACNYNYRGSFQKRDKTHCKIIQIEVKATIKKEVLRLKAKEKLSPEDALIVDSIIKLVDYEKNSQLFHN